MMDVWFSFGSTTAPNIDIRPATQLIDHKEHEILGKDSFSHNSWISIREILGHDCGWHGCNDE